MTGPNFARGPGLDGVLQAHDMLAVVDFHDGLGAGGQGISQLAQFAQQGAARGQDLGRLDRLVQLEADGGRLGPLGLEVRRAGAGHDFDGLELVRRAWRHGVHDLGRVFFGGDIEVDLGAVVPLRLERLSQLGNVVAHPSLEDGYRCRGAFLVPLHVRGVLEEALQRLPRAVDFQGVGHPDVVGDARCL